MSDLSTNLIEMATELRDPAKWAAIQIVKGGRHDMTTEQAFGMIEDICRQAIRSACKGMLAVGVVEELVEAARAFDSCLSTYCDGPERDALRAALAKVKEATNG